MRELHEPLFLRPSGKDYLWGGRRLRDDFAKELDRNPLAETWECSTHPEGESYVVGGQEDGRTLGEVLRAHPEYLGTRHAGSCELPILIKLIDARQDLSIQVHPTDEYAAAHEQGQRGKTEMWYVLDAAKGTKLVYGLCRDTSPRALRRSIADGTVMKYLQRVEIHRDDVFFVEAGTIHAIGAGALVAEIQQSSNLTYRLYDYDRVDRLGRKRPLHVDKALEAASLKAAPDPSQPIRVLKYSPGMACELLCRCRYFEVYRMLVNTERRQEVRCHADEVSFRVLLCIGGCGTLGYQGRERRVYKGDCIFLPADSVELSLHGQLQFLDVRG